MAESIVSPKDIAAADVTPAALEAELAKLAPYRAAWAEWFVTHGHPTTWERWPEFTPTLKAAARTLHDEWRMLPGRFPHPTSHASRKAS